MTLERQRCDNIASTFSDVATKRQPKTNVATTSCTSWVGFNKNSPNERNYKHFINYLYDDYKIKILHIILPKAATIVKSYDGQSKWIYFLIEDDNLLKN